MVNRSYEGDPIDTSWQDFEDRPYGGDGETVDVIDTTPHNQRGEVELPADFYLSEKYFQVFLALAEIGAAPLRDLAEAANITKEGARNAVEKLIERDLAVVEEKAAKYGADVFHPTVSPDEKFVFSNGITSDILPSNTHPIRLTPNQRRVLAHAARYPTKTKTKIGEAVGIDQVSVGRILRKHGDPRREIQHVSVGYTQSELELVEERIEHLKKRRSELKRGIKSGDGYRSEGGQ
jgi:DNA-binding MarR family transcriptional regulator